MSRSTDPRRSSLGPRQTSGGGEPGTQTAKAHELVAMAHALCDEGRAREAEDMARWALSQAPHIASGKTVLGRARLEQGHPGEARDLLEVVIRENPNFFPAHRWLAETLVRLGDWPRASEVLVRADALSPGESRIGQLVQQVMAASPGRPSGSGPAVPAPSVSPSLLPTGARLRTYEEPAITAKPPAALVRTTPGVLVPARKTVLLGNSTPTRGERPGVIKGPGPLGRAAAWLRRTLNPAPLVQWLRSYRRFLFIGAAVFALTVLVVSLVLRQPSGQLARQGQPGASGQLAPVTAGSFVELSSIRAKDRRRQVRFETEPTGRALLAEALLATEYGRPLDLDSEIWADELAEKEGGIGGPDEPLAARVLDRLQRGDRVAAGSLARTRGLSSSGSPLLRFVDGRRLERDGNLAAALARVGSDAERSAFLPLRLLRAELLLDQADPAAALVLVKSVLAESAGHPAALRLLLEARDALGEAVTGNEKDEVRRACISAERRIPTLWAACRLHAGTGFRRLGQRRAALREALRAADRAPDEPRLLAMIAQLLANLGATEEAMDLVMRTERLADPQFPPLAWARAGVGVGRDRLTKLPPGSPPGPEARLIAARSAFVGPAGRRRSLGAMGVTVAATKADDDLRWVVGGAEAKSKRAIMALTRRARTDKKAQSLGPVASYVVGTLARRVGEKPVADDYLSRSLDGHGDACRSATLYLMSQRSLGRDPQRNVKLQRAIGKLGCSEPPGMRMSAAIAD